LGCTHYPFLRDVIAELAGPEIVIVDTGAAVARELRRRLEEADLLCADVRVGRESFWASGNLATAAAVVRVLWNNDADVEPF
jgi:glutamate racemase